MLSLLSVLRTSHCCFLLVHHFLCNNRIAYTHNVSTIMTVKSWENIFLTSDIKEANTMYIYIF